MYSFRVISLSLGVSLALNSISVLASNTLFTALDDPLTAKKNFAANIQAGYNAQSGNSTNSTLLANSTATWFFSQTAYSLWGSATNTTSANIRSSERYQVGGRNRYNLNESNYLFGQAVWLTDRFGGYDSRSTFTSGYGLQVLAGPTENFRVELGPGIRHDEYHRGGRSTKALAYGAANYAYQLTDTTRFTQGLSALADDQTTLNSETALEVSMNKQFALRLSYTVNYNTEPPASAPKRTDAITSVTLSYDM